MRFESEHLILLSGFAVFCIWLFKYLSPKKEGVHQSILLGISVIISLIQMVKIPLDIYTGVFDVSSSLPFHMCSFLPFLLAWMYYTKSREVWGVIFFWSILGAAQANFTPGVKFSLFYYEALRFWLVHLFIIPLALFPAIIWKWELKIKDVWRTLIALNGTALAMYFINLVLGSNYMYVIGKPPNASFFDLLPEWPIYILVLEVVIAIWSLMLFGIFNFVKYGSLQPPEAITEGN
ncbi:MAG: TIGR02206 family membrane protein [Balneolaceae bacterium]